MQELNFIALDCEWANNDKDVCEIGITKVVKGEINDSKKWFICPLTNDTSLLGTDKCKVSEYDLYDEPIFFEIWDEIVSHIKDNVIICHNAKSADMDCLVKMLYKYKICNIPDLTVLCSCKFAHDIGHQTTTLSVLCSDYNIGQNCHHEAMDDTISCAKVFIECYKKSQKTFNEIVENSGKSLKDYYYERIDSLNPSKCININVSDINPKCNSPIFEGIKFCATGKEFRYGKFLTHRIIHKLGGQIQNVKKIKKRDLPDVIVYSAGCEDSRKVQDGKKWGVKQIISEEELFEYIRMNKTPEIYNEETYKEFDLFNFI